MTHAADGSPWSIGQFVLPDYYPLLSNRDVHSHEFIGLWLSTSAVSYSLLCFIIVSRSVHRSHPYVHHGLSLASSPLPSPSTSEAGVHDDDLHISKHSHEENEDDIETQLRYLHHGSQNKITIGNAEVGNGDENQGGP